MVTEVNLRLKRRDPELFDKMLEIQETLKNTGHFFLDGKNIEETFFKYCNQINYSLFLEQEYGRKPNFNSIKKDIDYLHKKVVR